MKQIIGNIVDITSREIFFGRVEVEAGEIRSIVKIAQEDHAPNVGYIIPGFVDSHIHIESSMLTPQRFGEMVIGRGTIATVSDPHEIANVMGERGIRFMLSSAELSPVKIHFTIPSSVPATPFDSSGAVISGRDVEQMAASGHFVALSEMMDVPAVLNQAEEVVKKLSAAKRYGLPIDGHAPLLRGEELSKYVESGISTDHEEYTLDTAREKIAQGMSILIREGSAARNFEALKPLIEESPDQVMFCFDDAHPDDILERGHIDSMVRRAIAEGYDLFDVLRIASLNPIRHYNLDVGALRVGDSADFIVVDDLSGFELREVYIDGELRWDHTTSFESDDMSVAESWPNKFNHDPIEPKDLEAPVSERIEVIGVIEGEIVTTLEHYTPSDPIANLESDRERDIAKIVYINRYNNTSPQVAFCRGFGLKRGAFASTIAHDSHNIIAVGCSDHELASAINALIESRGALVVADSERVELLPLPIAGIMSPCDSQTVAREYHRLQTLVKEIGCTLSSPFMTLAFMSLVVIPEVKIGEKGLFSFSKFNWISPNIVCYED